MKFKPIKYLEWAKANMGRVKYDLADGAMEPVPIEELGVNPTDIRLVQNAPHGSPELKEAIARRYDVTPANVVVTHGASMGLFLTYATLFNKGDEILLEVPNYEPLYSLGLLFDLHQKIWERPWSKRFDADMEALERRISKSTVAVVLTNIHNPSGVLIDAEKLRTIGQIARQNGARVIVGEAYLEGAFERNPISAFTLGSNMISIGSLSKIFGMNGLRLGWIICEEKLASEMHRVANYFSSMPAAPSERVALAAFERMDMLRERALGLLRRNGWVLREWSEGRENVEWIEPDGGPICTFRLGRGIDGMALVQLLKEKYDTLVVPGEYFWLKGFIRVGFGKDTALLRRGLDNLASAIEELAKSKGK